MRNYRKYLAATLAAAMVLGNATVVSATSTPSTPSTPTDVVLTGTPSEGESISGTINGNATMEPNVTMDVFSVVVPAFALDPSDVPAGVDNVRDDLRMTGVFDFILDPQKLITLTHGAKYVATASSPSNPSATPTEIPLVYEENATLFFEKNDGSFNSLSEGITITNRSTMAVNVTVDATFNSTDGIDVVTDKTFANIATPSVYMALVADGKETPIDPAKAKKASMSDAMAAAPAGAYEVQLNETTKAYEYVLVNEDAAFDTYTFQMKGASNGNADWSGINSVAGTGVVVTWRVEIPTAGAPSIATRSYKVPASGGLDIAVNLGAGNAAATGVESVTFKTNAGDERTVATTDYSYADGVVRFKGAMFTSEAFGSSVTSRVYTITFNDTAKTAIEVTVSR